MEKNVHTLVIGAGPAGLAAAYTLAKAGIPVVVIEKSDSAGGLMRSIRRGDFIVDIGRKELYTRIPKVNALWESLLEDDYISYSHREGILYRRHVLEASNAWRGIRRGMPFAMILSCAFDYAMTNVKYGFSKPTNYTEYWYRRRGKKLSQILSQGYEEKFKGIQWNDLPIPAKESGDTSAETESIKKLHQAERIKPVWRHPAKGSGQICERLEEEISRLGGEILLKADIVEITSIGNRIDTVKVVRNSETITYRPLHIVSSIPVEGLKKFLGHVSPPKSHNMPVRGKRSAICLYLFFDEPPRFPHVWLKVTCPQMKVGRITNYAAFNGKMIPDGKTCLCLEFFCTGEDSLLQMDDEALRQLGIAECVNAGVADSNKCIDFFVLRLPGINAATSWRDDAWRNLLLMLNSFENLYNVNRPGTDKATYAGIEAASAILADDKSIFDRENALTLPIDIRQTANT